MTVDMGISSARAIPAAEPALQKAWIIIQGNPRRQKVFINGRADSVANDAVNQPLSEQRAQAVADRLIKHGYLTRAMIVPQGFGRPNRSRLPLPPQAGPRTDDGDSPIETFRQAMTSS